MKEKLVGWMIEFKESGKRERKLHYKLSDDVRADILYLDQEVKCEYAILYEVYKKGLKRIYKPIEKIV